MTDAWQPDAALLNASAASYTILPGQTWSPPSGNQYYDAVHWTDTPCAVVGGTKDVDAALVGAAQLVVDGASQEAVIVAFRGTLPPAGPAPTPSKVFDWLVNDILGTFAQVPVIGFGDGAAVHSGFWLATTTIWPEVEKAIAAADNGRGLPLYLTGHSKGGPMATLAAAYLHQQGGAAPHVVTFASPHPGNGAFAAAYDKVIAQRRWEFAKDVVPLVPPTPAVAEDLADLVAEIPDVGADLAAIFRDAATWDYQPVGTRLYINSAGHFTHFGLDEAARLALDIAPEIATGGLAAVGHAHCCTCETKECDGGYQRGVCGGDCC